MTIFNRFLLTLGLSLTSAFSLAASVDAQGSKGVGGIVIKKVPPPIRGLVDGQPGPTIEVGTTGPDHFRDDGGGPDVDSFRDAPRCPDGKNDRIDLKDGDGLDTGWGGPEDTFEGDPQDKIYIHAGEGVILWQGTFEQYLVDQAVTRWVRDRLQSLWAWFQAHLFEIPNGFWPFALQQVSAELAAVEPPDGEVLFSDLFSIGPYEVGPVPPSPLRCLSWFPYPEEVDPAEATAGLLITPDEFHRAVAVNQTLLQYLIAVSSD